VLMQDGFKVGQRGEQFQSSQLLVSGTPLTDLVLVCRQKLLSQFSSKALPLRDELIGQLAAPLTRPLAPAEQ